MKIQLFNLILACLMTLISCEEITVVNELPDTGLIITSIYPEIGGAGMTIEIEGSGFRSTAMENRVTFDGIAAIVKAASPTRIIATVPESISTGPVNVQVGEETAIGPVFTVDGRLAFVGEYTAQDYSMKYTGEPDGIVVDTTITVIGEAKISAYLSKDGTDLLQLNFAEFIGEGLLQTVPVSIDVFDEYASYFITVVKSPSLARISGGEFELNKTTFEVTAIGRGNILTLPGEFSGEGLLMDDGAILLNFKYRILFFGTLSGEAVLQKE